MTGADDTSWMGILALIVFFVFFVGVIVWVFRPGSTGKYREWGDIPLDDDAPLPDGIRPDGSEKDK